MSLEKKIAVAITTCKWLAPNKLESELRLQAVKAASIEVTKGINFSLAIIDAEKANPITASPNEEAPDSGFHVKYGVVPDKNNNRKFDVVLTYTSEKHKFPVVLGMATVTFKTPEEINQDLQARGIDFKNANSSNSTQPTVPTSWSIEVTFSNDGLESLLERETIVPGMLKRVAAEQALRSQLAFMKLSEIEKKQKEALTPLDQLVLAVNQALHAFLNSNDSFQYRAQVFDAMRNLLKAQTIDNCKVILDLAAKVDGAPNSLALVVGIVVMSIGVGFILMLEGLGSQGLFVDPTLLLVVGMIAGVAITAFSLWAVLNAVLPRGHSAELRIVEVATWELAPKQDSFFSSIFTKVSGADQKVVDSPVEVPTLS
jgi:hypothetical protein